MRDEENKENIVTTFSGESEISSDDLKGKKVDADLDSEKDRPAEQKQ